MRGKGARAAAASLHQSGFSMRAETEAIVDEIKQSVGLLRRHL
jgi:hypothetical protein